MTRSIDAELLGADTDAAFRCAKCLFLAKLKSYRYEQCHDSESILPEEGHMHFEAVVEEFRQSIRIIYESKYNHAN